MKVPIPCVIHVKDTKNAMALDDPSPKTAVEAIPKDMNSTSSDDSSCLFGESTHQVKGDLSSHLVQSCDAVHQDNGHVIVDHLACPEYSDKAMFSVPSKDVASIEEGSTL